MFLGHCGAQLDRRPVQRLHMVAPVTVGLARRQAEARGDQRPLRTAPRHSRFLALHHWQEHTGNAG